MAKKEAKKTTSKPQAKGKGGIMISLIILMIVGAIFLPISIILLAGLIPSLAILLTDKSRGRSVTVSVGALNLTGVAFVIIQMVRKGISLDYAIALLSDPTNWLIMWGGAGFGYALLSVIPPMVAQVLTGISEMKVQKLKNNQVEIRKIWGDNVKG